VYWHAYKAHLPEARALGQAAQVSLALAQALSEVRHQELQRTLGYLRRLHAAGFELPGDPAVLASAFTCPARRLLRDLAREGREPAGRVLSDDEAIDTLTGLLAHGLTGRQRSPQH
jgi:hypothetical protein